jgi:predicted RND superfamily exporter protein
MLVLRRPAVPVRMNRSARRAWHFRRERLEQHWLGRPRLVIWVGAVITTLAAVAAVRLSFDYNPLRLQSRNLPSVLFEQRLAKSASRSILSAVVTASSVPEALALEQKLRRLPGVAEVDSVAPMLAGDQARKLELVRQIRVAAADIQLVPMDRAPVDVPELDQTLKEFGRAVVGAVQFMGGAMDEGLKKQLYGLREAVGRWRTAIAATQPAQCATRVTLYQRAFFGDLAETLGALQHQDYREPLRAEDLPTGMRSRFVGRTGRLLLQVYPRGNIWEHEVQKEFVRELRTVAPAATGAPVQFYENTTRLKKNFQVAAAYALAVIALMLLAHFRNGACVLLALLPVGAGILWTFGLMGLFQIPFNPANIIAPTLLVGIGVANGIHILNRFIEEKQPSILGKSTGKAVLVSALTTSTGFGSLYLAQHQGIASLGLVMASGTVLCLIASVTVLPALLILLSRAGLRLGHGWLTAGK